MFDLGSFFADFSIYGCTIGVEDLNFTITEFRDLFIGQRLSDFFFNFFFCFRFDVFLFFSFSFFFSSFFFCVGFDFGLFFGSFFDFFSRDFFGDYFFCFFGLGFDLGGFGIQFVFVRDGSIRQLEAVGAVGVLFGQVDGQGQTVAGLVPFFAVNGGLPGDCVVQFDIGVGVQGDLIADRVFRAVELDPGVDDAAISSFSVCSVSSPSSVSAASSAMPKPPAAVFME